MLNNYKNKDKLIENVFNSVFDKYDLMNDLMSFGIHRLWKKDLISWLSPQKNTSLIDVASGTGDIANLYLKETSFKGKAFCLDNNLNMLRIGKKKLGNIKNISWFNAAAEKLPFQKNFFDYYTISFGIRNVRNIDKALKEAYRVLKPGGRFICLEFSKIENEPLNKLYKYYSKIIPKIGKIIIGKSKPYEYLINSIKDFYSQEQFLEKIKKYNFKKAKYRNLFGGIASIHSGWKI